VSSENQNPIRILAIETSCDETAVAVICDCHSEFISESHRPQNKSRMTKTPCILSNVVSSQIDLHTKTGGVVPEVASRAHLEAIIPVIQEALLQASATSSQCHSQLDRESTNVGLRPQGHFSGDLRRDDNLKELPTNLLSEITHIAVTAGPGLIGSLMIGFDSAKSLAYGLDLPIVPVNHIEGHIYSALVQNTNSKSQALNSKQIQNINDQNSKQFGKLENSNLDIVSPACRQGRDLVFGSLEFPLIALTVSGGHTSLTLMADHGKYQTIGETLDDAAGEAFDKVAKLLNLGYPGGPIVSEFASKYRHKNNKKQEIHSKDPFGANSKQITNSKNNFLEAKHLKANGCIQFPRPMLDRPDFDFSFSGLKTSVLTEVKRRLVNKKELSKSEKEEICFAFEEAVADVLVSKTLKAAKKYKPKAVILAGGVAANNRLRKELKRRLLEMTKDKYQVSNKISNSKSLNQNQCKSVKKISDGKLRLSFPPKDMTGDNAAMIGLAAYYHIKRGKISTWDKIELDSNMKL